MKIRKKSKERNGRKNIVNALTVDVEDYFQIHAFSNVILPEDWDSFESTVERNTYRVLDLLDACKGPDAWVEGGYRQPFVTFFILGWIAERYPHLVTEIHARGHEVACHGYAHQRVFTQTRNEFREDVKKAKEILESLTGVEVIGYRAPTYSITKKNLWALEILFEMGFRYDSSIFPIKHDFYGFPEAPRFPFYIDFTNGDILSQCTNPKPLPEIRDFGIGRPSAGQELPLLLSDSAKPGSSTPINRTGMNPDHETLHTAGHTVSNVPRTLENCLVEFPLSTVAVWGRNLPYSGGGYFRLFPYWYTKLGFKKVNEDEARPAVFYTHPWEFDPELPLVARASWLAKFRTYVNLKSTEAKFSRLLGEFRFAPLASMLHEYLRC